VRGRARLEQPPRDFESGEARHLDIEEDDIGAEPIDRRDRFESVARLPDDFHAAELTEQKAELVARQLLVVHQHCPQVHRQAVTRSGIESSGMAMLAQVPWPGTLVSFRW